MSAAFDHTSNSEPLITKDFLGGLSSNPESDFNSKTEHASRKRCSSPNPEADFQSLNLNYPPPSSSSSAAAEINHFEESCLLDFKLQSSSQYYQSVCTLEKVKSALQRSTERETEKKRPSPLPSSSAMFAAACPHCLLYVITLETNPKCPRCNSIVPSPLFVKKAKIDLNASVQY